MQIRIGAALVVGLLAFGAPGAVRAQPPNDLYSRALGRERALRAGAQPPSVRQIRGVVAAYERIVDRYPRSGYADNALWQAGNLALLAYERFGEDADKGTGVRVLALLRS